MTSSDILTVIFTTSCLLYLSPPLISAMFLHFHDYTLLSSSLYCSLIILTPGFSVTLDYVFLSGNMQVRVSNETEYSMFVFLHLDYLTEYDLFLFHPFARKFHDFTLQLNSIL